MFVGWQYQKVKAGHDTVHVYAANHWNVGHIAGQFRNDSLQEIERQMNHWKTTNERLEWHYMGRFNDGDVYCICDNEDRRCNKPPVGMDVTELVCSVLRGEHEEWHTGRVATAEVWST